MFRRKRVSDVMTKDVATVTKLTPFKDIARLLGERKVSAVPVVDNAGYPLGVVSETDLLRKQEFGKPHGAGRLARWRRSPRARAAALTAGDIMSAPAIRIDPGATLTEAARILHRHDINRLVVTDEAGLLVGIVTRSDLLRVYDISDNELAERVRRDVVEFSLWEFPFSVTVEVEDGIVTMSGELERKSMVPLAIHLTRSVDGVVDVIDKLTWAVDDTAIEGNAPSRRVGTKDL